MDSSAPAPRKASALVWVGRVISAVPVALLVMSAYFKLSKHEVAVKGWQDGGFPANTLVPIGIAEIVSTILYVIPQTATLGAILLTGYLGGAVCTHVRAGEAFHMPIICGVLAWLGLLLRDARLRPLLPFRSLPRQD